MQIVSLKIGEVARRASLTIRTLHYYDKIGLLRPSLRTKAGHRLYTAADIARLQQVLSLRQLGFSLEQIRAWLERADFSPVDVIRMHVARLREQIARQSKLCERLETIGAHLELAEMVSFFAVPLPWPVEVGSPQLRPNEPFKCRTPTAPLLSAKKMSQRLSAISKSSPSTLVTERCGTRRKDAFSNRLARNSPFSNPNSF